MDDRALVKRFFSRDENAIAEAKQRYGSYCLYIAQNILCDKDDAEECLNDVLLAAWNSIPPQEPSNLKTYLGKLTRESAIDMFRKKSAKKRNGGEALLSLDELEEVIGQSSVEEAFGAKELSRLISSFLYSLREDERNVFIRRYYYYDPVKSICERYGFGKSKVTSLLKRTRDKLADYLKKEGYII